ncbi:helix-turn-helix domain-containing protein [Roseiconus nitratireducens]|uniref:Helix-turn-helix domain-containing protein n=1 Tax=Roseiconus nitratireducens TaxID=2605748 RepID=A0A5M6DFP1_9BACT|nr:helix-turn-helix domain-containing protein [Roseiconus nitratireducens]
MHKELITPQLVARLLGVSTKSVRRLAAAGKMPPPIRVGRLLRWRAGAIHEWIDAGCPAERDRRSNSNG